MCEDGRGETGEIQCQSCRPQLLLLAADVVHERVPYLALLDGKHSSCDHAFPPTSIHVAISTRSCGEIL